MPPPAPAVTCLAAPAEMVAFRQCKGAGSCGAASNTVLDAQPLAGCAVHPLRPHSTVDLRRGRGWQNPFYGEAGSGWPLEATIATGVVGRVLAIRTSVRQGAGD